MTTCETREEDQFVVCTREDGTIIQEDDPDWDCEVMGNLVCGPNTNDPYPVESVVVSQATPPVPTEVLARTGISSGALIGIALTMILVGYFFRYLARENMKCSHVYLPHRVGESVIWVCDKCKKTGV